MKKLAMTLLAFVLSLTCISGILAASAETSEIKEVKETTTGVLVKDKEWTVTKKYFAASYTMKIAETIGQHGENGCCGIILGGGDGYACFLIPFDGGLDEKDPTKLPTFKNKVIFGPWWTEDNAGKYKAAFKIDNDQVGKEVTIMVLCSQEDGKLTIDSLYLNGTKLVDGTLIDNDTPRKFEGCTLDGFDGHVGFATKASGVEYTAKFVESDEKLDEKCFDAKPAPTPDPDPKPDPDPGKKPSTTPDPDQPPKTGTASVVIASVAVISLAGVVIAAKKREQD